MSYRLSAEASGVAQGSAVRFLLVEGKSPIRIDLELVLRRRFPGALMDRLFFTQHGQLQAVDWCSYDLVVISATCPVEGGVAWLETLQQGEPRSPLVVVLTSNDGLVRQAVWGKANLLLSLDDSNIEFAARLDALLEVQRVLLRYPLALPEWRFLEVLHDTDNAVIFLAENCAGGKVVIKRFKFDTAGLEPSSFNSFLSDAESLAGVCHPGLVKIIGAGVTDCAIYLVMEYVEGYTLKYLLAEFDLPDLGRVLPWFRQVAEALGAVHSLGLLHRDLKASNVLVRGDGTPVLLDFGIESKLLMDSGFLREDEIYCTPYYVSPERIAGEAASVQSDLYALGVLLFEMLAGEKPYTGSSLLEILQKQVFEPIPQLPEAFAAYQPLVSLLLSKSPECRPESVQAVLGWLDGVGDANIITTTSFD